MRRILLLLLCLLPVTARTSEPISTPPKILHTWWFSHYEQIARRVDIYVPEADIPLPVLYLIHGINGYEGAWQDRGSAVDTLATMIAEGRCKPMILVMPDCNKWPTPERPIVRGSLWQCLTHYSQLSHEHILEYAVSDLMTMIDTTYAVTEKCSVAGLSDGARIAANIANIRPDRIYTVGLFSPVLSKKQLPINTGQQFYIYVGKNDFFKPNGKRFHRRMNKAGYPHLYIENKGNHDWPVWRQNLSDFLSAISSSEASVE